jgi:hypothetical protein
VEETHYLIGAIGDTGGLTSDDDVWALSIRSTAITVMRNKFLAPLSKLRIDVGGVRKQPPIFGSKWRVSSERTGNQEGSWFTYRFALLGKVGDPEGPTDEEFQIGCDLHQMYASSGQGASSSVSALPSQTERPRGKIAITSGHGARQPSAPPPSGEDEPAGPRSFAPIDVDEIPH